MDRKMFLTISVIVSIGFLIALVINGNPGGFGPITSMIAIYWAVVFIYIQFIGKKIDDAKKLIEKNLAEKELLKNKELFDKGILTEEEYQNKMVKLKKKI